MRRILAAAALALTLAAPAAAQSDTSLTDQLYQVTIAQGPRAVLPAVGRDTVVMLPLGAVLRLAEIRVTEVRDGEGLAARIEPDRTALTVDLATAMLGRGDSTRPLEAGLAVWRDGELFLAAPLLAWLLDVMVDIDRTELSALASRTQDLPVVRRRLRELQRQALRDPFAARPAVVDLPAGRPNADGAVLDWSYLGMAHDPLGTASVQLALGTQAFGGGLETSVRHQRSPFERRTDTRATWTGVWPERAWLRQARVGDFFSGARRSQVLQGVEIGNAPYLRSAAFGAELLDGRPGTGWQIDLLRDGELVGFAATDSTGAYALPVPVQYGLNAIELEATGPAGERMRRRLLVVVPFDRLPAGALEYTVSAGRCRQRACTGALQAGVRYGLSPAVTLEAGSDAFWRDSLPDVWAPYALVAASPLPVAHASLERVANGFARARAEYNPTPDLQLEASHAVYDTTVAQSPVGAGGVRQTSDLTLFWRPAAARDLLVQASASRTRGLTGPRNAIGASVVLPLRTARLTGGLGWERSGGGAAARGSVRAHGSVDAVLRGPVAWLRQTFVRTGFAMETGEGLTLLGLTAGRRVSPSVRIDAGLVWRRTAGTALELGFSTDFPGARVGSHTRYAPGSGLSGTQSAEGSLLWNARERRVEFADGRSLGRSGVVGTVFLDLNGDGTRNPDEPAADGVRVRVGSRGAVSDSAGRFEAWDLVPFEAMTVEVHGPSLANPLWVPAVDGVRLSPRPNTVERVDLPLAPAGELEGMVRVAGEGRGVGALGLVLRHLASGTVARVVTFGDGSFYASGLRPGVYRIEPAREALESLGLAEPDVKVTVRPFDAQGAPAVTIELERR